jgi:UDP-GlcNAc:undecaprenyl-phosphate/decaprenyl-phosphate GlcNAc-1-phosphate transferase
MSEYVLTMLVAAVVTYLLTPLARRFAIAVGAEHAARDRDVHVVPTPLLGGFAMYAGLAAALFVASRLPVPKPAFAQTNMAGGLLLAGGLLVLMGFVDDRWGMGALSKLCGQIAAGGILVWSGAAIPWLPMPGGSYLYLTYDESLAATILVVVATINAVNFMDGLDGLAAGIVGIGAAAFFIYYYTLTHRLGLEQQTGPALASAVLAGVCLGFLPHNFHPARIFMGDTGAMLIGLLLAYAPISSLTSFDPFALTSHAAYTGGTVNRFGAILPLLLPGVILLIPYADLLMAVIRRTRAGLSPFVPDRKHLHHRLLDIGHSHRRSVLIMYLWAALFSGSVVWLSIVRTPLFVLASVTLAAMLVLLLLSMPRLRPWARRPAAAGAVLGAVRAAAADSPRPVAAAAPGRDGRIIARGPAAPRSAVLPRSAGALPSAAAAPGPATPLTAKPAAAAAAAGAAGKPADGGYQALQAGTPEPAAERSWFEPANGRAGATNGRANRPPAWEQAASPPPTQSASPPAWPPASPPASPPG